MKKLTIFRPNKEPKTFTAIKDCSLRAQVIDGCLVVTQEHPDCYTSLFIASYAAGTWTTAERG